MTREQFAREYAQRSNTTVEFLREHGQEVRPCVCGDKNCIGWQMAHVRIVEWPEDSPFPKSDPRYTAAKKTAGKVYRVTGPRKRP